jgi:hypothetical protein
MQEVFGSHGPYTDFGLILIFQVSTTYHLERCDIRAFIPIRDTGKLLVFARLTPQGARRIPENIRAQRRIIGTILDMLSKRYTEEDGSL